MKQITKHRERLALLALLIGALTGSQAKAETLLTDFDNNFYFDAMYAGWGLQDGLTGGATNWTITATNYGSATTLFYEEDQFTPRIVDASGDEFVELQVEIAVGPGDFAGPLLILEDEDGTRYAWAWYGLGSGQQTLVNSLSSPTYIEAAGTVAGLDLTNLVRFDIGCDPGFGATLVYTLTLMNLRTYPAPPPACVTLISDFDNTGVDGGYANWNPAPAPQPDNYTVTATGFGGGYKNISPNVNALGETTVELQVTVTNTADETGVTVVFQDGDGTQETWSWYGLTNGNYLLSQSLYAGSPVAAQPGTIPGLDVSNLDWFHIQADPGIYTNNSYTVIYENLAIVGFNPEITDFSYDLGANQFELIWNSRPDRSYSVSYVSDLTGAFSLLASNIVSGGTSTTNAVTVPVGDSGFVQVSEECE